MDSKMSSDREAALAAAAPNYINPPTRAPMVTGVNIAFIVFALIFVVLRCISRITILGKFTVEDHLIVVAWFLSLFLSFCMIWSIKQGTGRHMKDVPVEWLLNPVFPATWVMTWVYTLALTAIKASMVIFCLRLIPQRMYKYASYTILFFVVSSGLVETFLLIFGCSPIRASWDAFTMEPGSFHCIDAMKMYRVVAYLNTIGDFFVLVLPLPMVWQLQLPIRQKLSVLVIFLLGGLVFVISIVRIFLVIQAEESGDYTWVGALSAVWSGIEVNIAIVVGCLPSIKPLLSKYFPRFLQSTGFQKTMPKASYAAGYAPYQMSNMKSGNHNGTQKSGVFHGKDDGVLTSVLGRKSNNPNESEEYIVNSKNEDGPGITKTVEFNVKVDASSEFGTTTQNSDRSRDFREKGDHHRI